MVVVIVSLKPLNHLQIILVLAFRQLFDIYNFLDPNFFAALLEYLQVLQEFVFEFRGEIHFVHGNLACVHCVYYLAVYSALP